MPFFKVEFKRYHYPKTPFGEDLDYDDYIDVQIRSFHKTRDWFATCYHSIETLKGWSFQYMLLLYKNALDMGGAILPGALSSA